MTPEKATTLRASAGRRVVGLMWAFLCAAGAALILYDFSGLVRVFPGSAVLAAVLLLLTVLVGVGILEQARPIRPPSRPWAWSAVAWGGTAATGSAIVANTGLQGVWFKTAGIDFGSRWGAALTAPLNEELLKVSGVLLIALGSRRLVRGPLDGFFLGAFTGLGFQVVENWTFAMNSLVIAGGIDEGAAVGQSFTTRVVLTGVGSHWAMTAVAGTGVGILLAHRSPPAPRRHLAALLCLLMAMAMHWFFDSPFLGSVAGIAGKAVLNFLVALGFYLTLRRGVRDRARAFLLSPETDLSPDLLTRGSRRSALRGVPPAQRADAAARAALYLDEVEEHAAVRPRTPRRHGDPNDRP
ncbi:PrsW family intramembrane metalloprotease [Streptomyces sp. NPDC087420]|uniref:PrsW family intramembrane metalloprotease n=1 Tax=Streptomyces sp. NPDC087420 TaxID=3365785 RepID=UPI00383538CC